MTDDRLKNSEELQQLDAYEVNALWAEYAMWLAEHGHARVTKLVAHLRKAHLYPWETSYYRGVPKRPRVVPEPARPAPAERPTPQEGRELWDQCPYRKRFALSLREAVERLKGVETPRRSC